ncbi:unnamed protein product, partial [Thelazia callipaeda]|uniref:POU domain protein n=1 Tax=Thelazia callipaeda TaxID=103827 RepID=A0A0N5D995_THECL
ANDEVILIPLYYQFRANIISSCSSSITKEEKIDLDELENFAQNFKKQRIKFGFTQGDVGLALGRRYGTDFSQTTISRFEALNLSFKNMCKLRPLLKEWLEDAEAALASGATISDLLDFQYIIYEPKIVNSVVFCMPLKKRRKRTNLDLAQRSALDAYFDKNPRPDHDKMAEIAQLVRLDRDVSNCYFLLFIVFLSIR